MSELLLCRDNYQNIPPPTDHSKLGVLPFTVPEFELGFFFFFYLINKRVVHKIRSPNAEVENINLL